jgi:predicted nucleotide-binding protein (sugar kinase/HSP70/actin superfamily)
MLWTMENAAKDKPYEYKPGDSKKWLKESIDLIKQSMPKEEGEK